MDRERIIVAGINGEEVGSELLKTLRKGYSLLVCSKATRALIEKELEDDIEQRWVSFVPLEESLKKIREFSGCGKVIVVTSGDPLFFGFGRTLMKRIPNLKATFVPAVSSMQLCFSRFSIPWEQATFVSLHGRSIAELYPYLGNELLFILTDGNNSPARIAEQLIKTMSEIQRDQYAVMVGEHLGFKDEKLFRGSLAETARMTFSVPNCLILQKTLPEPAKRSGRLGLKEEEIRHSRGLITKDEVRAAVLHKLCLPEKGVFWDIGAGSGSISIEASRLNPGMRVFSIERNQQEIANINYNIKAFGCVNIRAIHGTAPEVFSQIPSPDCVFIGGSGGRLEQIIEYLDSTAGCKRVVITAVTEKTAAEAPAFLLSKNFIVQKSTISVSRCMMFPGKQTSEKEETLNTIHIISGEKKNGKRH